MKAKRILLFLALVMAGIAAMSFVIPDNGINIGDVAIRFTSLHEIVESRAQQDAPQTTETAEAAVPAPTTDSVAYYRQLVNNGNLRFWLPNPHYMDAFWRAAARARQDNRTLRVLHYGDSQIEMDHITSRLRSYMQHTFGGEGPGMLPFHTITPVMSARLGTTGELLHVTSFGDSTTVRSRGNYGPMMQCFRLAGGSATASVRPANSSHADQQVKSFNHVKLLANSRHGFTATLSTIKGKGSQRQTAGTGFSALEWPADSLITNGFRVNVSGSADLYALLVDGAEGGVAVDNIPMRGCSGQQFTLVSESLLTDAYTAMDVGLIILQFGGNSVPYMRTAEQVSKYCTSIGRQIDYLHRCCPSAKILFIGPSDMSVRRQGKLQTYPIIPQLIDSLSAMAISHDAAFWSIYHAMGGENSMLTWSRNGLAGSDYIHFSQRGADRMGDMLSEAFSNLYRLYQLEHSKKKRKTVIR